MISTITSNVGTMVEAGVGAAPTQLGVAALLVLLVVRELAGSAGQRFRPLADSLIVPIAPLFVVLLSTAVIMSISSASG